MKIIIDSLVRIYYEKEIDSVLFPSFSALQSFVSPKTRERNKVEKKSYNLALINKEKQSISFNVGYGKLILSELLAMNRKFYENKIKIRDDRVDMDAKIRLKHPYQPRDHLQERSINKFLKSKKNGTLIAPCGAGKTIMALKIIEAMTKKTLIIVDEKMLSDQWKDEILDPKLCNYPADRLGELNGDVKDYIDKDIIIATKQSLLNDDEIFEYIKEHCSFVIVDECHTAPTKIFNEILTKIKPKFRLGLTATPDRQDGFDFLLNLNIGPVIDKINQRELIKAGSILESTIVPVFLIERNRILSGGYWNKKLEGKKINIRDWQKMIAELRDNKKIHKEVATNIYKAYQHGYVAAVVLAQKKWIDNYYKLLIGMGVKPDEIEIIKGETEKDYRKDVIKRAKSGEIKIILTSKLLDKGISINRLDCIHLVFPSKSSGNTEQRVGRIARLHPDKKPPIVFDYIYDNYIYFNHLTNSFQFSRYKAYKKTSNTKTLDLFIKLAKDYFSADNVNVRQIERSKIINHEVRALKKNIKILA